MESNNQKTQTQGYFADAKVFLSKDSQYVIHVLPGNQIVRKHINFYKKILGVEFTPKALMKTA
jgi:hypothetical protein